jgi:Tol biopolymer transport system component
MFPPSGWAGFSASRNGTIAFLTAPDNGRLAWIDASGGTPGYLGTPGNYLGVHDTPGGEHILATRMDNATGVYDIWSLDATSGTESRVTSGPSTNLGPVVTPTGTSLIYSKSTGGAPELYEREIAGGSETRLAPGEGFQQAVSITRDGGTLVYLQRRQRGDWDVWKLPLTGAHTPAPVVATTFNEPDARLSPDDRVLALVSDETGHAEIYVTPFPEGSPKYRVSTAGGRTPRWAAAGRTLMFIADDGRLMRADVTFDTALRTTRPVPAFATARTVAWRDFLPLGGGRLLAVVPEALPREEALTLITNAVR